MSPRTQISSTEGRSSRTAFRAARFEWMSERTAILMGRSEYTDAPGRLSPAAVALALPDAAGTGRAFGPAWGRARSDDRRAGADPPRAAPADRHRAGLPPVHRAAAPRRAQPSAPSTRSAPRLARGAAGPAQRAPGASPRRER